MKIGLSRRSRAFIAKWGGLVLASVLVLPIAVLGGTYLYASGRVDATTNYVTQAIYIAGLEVMVQAPEPTSNTTYRLFLGIYNETPDAAQISIANAKLQMNDYTFEIIDSTGWQDRVAGNSVLTFQVDIIIGPDNVPTLSSEPLDVTLKMTGTMTARARYAFVSKEETRRFNITSTIPLQLP